MTATSVNAQLVSEKPDGIAERAVFHYGSDPMATLNSYAVAKITSLGPCSGTMIGPNVLITAAHCRSGNATADFRVYVSPTDQRGERFQCSYLLHTWPEMDLLAYWCFPNSTGENPGDKWGYVDFELSYRLNGAVDHARSRNLVQVGDPLVSLWWNAIGATGDHTIYSRGKVTDTSRNLWANPGGDLCEQDDDDRVGIHSDVWGAGGASGSLQFVPATGRAILAPLSTADTGVNNDGGPSRSASAVADLFELGILVDTEVSNPMVFDNLLVSERCRSKSNPHISLSTLENLWDAGIRFDNRWSNGSKYIGSLDKNGNGVLDMQEDLERSAREGARDLYYLGFHSQRLNVQAVTGPSAQVNWLGHLGFLEVSDTRTTADPDDTVLQATRQLVTWPGSVGNTGDPVWVLVNSRGDAEAKDALRICMGECKPVAFGNGNSDTVTRGFTGGAPLSLHSASRLPGIVWEAVVVRPDTVHDFDMADKRRLWSSRLNSSARQRPADIRPLGRNSATSVDWAAVISDRRDGTTAEFSLHSHLIPIPAGQAMVCFDARRMPGVIGGGNGVFRFASSGQDDRVFSLAGSGWQRVCGAMNGVASNGSTLSFGTMAEADFAYVVDNIEISWRPITQHEAPDDGVVLPVTDEDSGDSDDDSDPLQPDASGQGTVVTQ